MAIVKAKFLPIRRSGGIYANNSMRYALERDAERGSDQERTAFDSERGAISADEALAEIEEAKGKYYYHLILNAGDEKTDVDLQDWTKDTMANLENSLGEQGKDENLKWMAVEHDDHATHDHVHVVLITDHKLDRDDLKDLREYCSESFDSRRELLKEFEQDFTRDSAQQQTQQATISHILDAVPSQGASIASGTEDNTNAPKKKRERKQDRERDNDESW